MNQPVQKTNEQLDRLMRSKKQIILFFVVALLGLVLLTLASCGPRSIDRSYRFTVRYTCGESNCYDRTDSIVNLGAGMIKYYDETDCRWIQRAGSYSIEENPMWKQELIQQEQTNELNNRLND